MKPTDSKSSLLLYSMPRWALTLAYLAVPVMPNQAIPRQGMPGETKPSQAVQGQARPGPCLRLTSRVRRLEKEFHKTNVSSRIHRHMPASGTAKVSQAQLIQCVQNSNKPSQVRPTIPSLARKSILEVEPASQARLIQRVHNGFADEKVPRQSRPNQARPSQARTKPA